MYMHVCSLKLQLFSSVVLCPEWDVGSFEVDSCV